MNAILKFFWQKIIGFLTDLFLVAEQRQVDAVEMKAAERGIAADQANQEAEKQKVGSNVVSIEERAREILKRDFK